MNQMQETNPGNTAQPPMIGRRQFVAAGSVAAASIALFGLSGCSPTSTASTGSNASGAAVGYTPGAYEAEAPGKKGPVKVKATFSEDAIESVEVVESLETPRISAVPFERIPEQIVEYQSLAVDTVAGATLCSMGVLAAVEDCVRQAGGDAAALKKVPGPEKSTAEEAIDADIVVVGAGAAGLAAAVQASMNGAKVAVFEKCANIGGNMLVSGGVLTYIEAPDELRQDMNDGYRGYFAQTLNKARALGVPEDKIELVQKQFDDYYAAGSTKVFDSPEWQAIYYIIASGATEYVEGDYEGMLAYANGNIPLMEWLAQFDIDYKKLIAVAGYPWPDNVSPATGECGEGYCEAFDRYLTARGNPIGFLFSTSAEKLITDESGAVVGVKGTCQDGTVYTANAKKGVILATGGFSGNTELLLAHDDEWGFANMGISTLPTTNNYGHTGDGLLMAMEVGGAFAESMPNYMILPFANAVDQSVESIVGDSGNALLVNKEGKRFVDESKSRNEISKAQMNQTDQMCYLISDANNSGVVDGYNMFGTDVRQMLDNNKLYKADTLDELAALIAMDADALKATVATYNDYAAKGVDPDFNRTMFTETSPVVEGPFYANPCHWAMHITNAGIAIDFETSQVIDENEQPVTGLYAIGEVTPTGGGIDVMNYGINLANQLTA